MSVIIYKLPYFDSFPEEKFEEELKAHGGIIYGSGIRDTIEKLCGNDVKSCYPPLNFSNQEVQQQFKGSLESPSLVYQKNITNRQEVEMLFTFLRANAPKVPVLANSYFYQTSMNEQALSHPYADQYLVLDCNDDPWANGHINKEFIKKLSGKNIPPEDLLEILSWTDELRTNLETEAKKIWDRTIWPCLTKLTQWAYRNGDFREAKNEFFLSRLAYYLPLQKDGSSPWRHSDSETGRKEIGFLGEIGNFQDITLLFEGIIVPLKGREDTVEIGLPHPVFEYFLAKKLEPPCKDTENFPKFIKRYRWK